MNTLARLIDAAVNTMAWCVTAAGAIALGAGLGLAAVQLSHWIFP